MRGLSGLSLIHPYVFNSPSNFAWLSGVIAAFCFIFSVLEDYHNRETTNFGGSFGSDSNDQLRVGDFSIHIFMHFL